MYGYKIIIYCFLYLGSTTALSVPNSNKIISAKDRFKLHSGDFIPYVGQGTAGPIEKDAVFKHLDNTLAAGYRLIDTAEAYRTEEPIGEALKVLLPKYNLTRKDIFITTKFDTSHYGEEVAPHLESSLKKLGVEYVDLYLIHHPGIYQRNAGSSGKTVTVLKDEINIFLRDETWQQFVTAQKKGLARNIGVSNYMVSHLKELLKNDHGVKPAVNQVEWNPGHYNTELLKLCKDEGILLQAYSPLGGKRHSFLGDDNVKKIAEKLKKTPAQVLLRWSLQQGVGTVSRASSKERCEENLDIDFRIPEEDMKILFSTEPSPPNPFQNPNLII